MVDANNMAQSERSLIGKSWRYAVTGLASNGLLYVLYLVITFAGVPPTLALTVVFAAGVIFSYTVNRSWSFKSRRNHRQAFSRFVLLYVGAYFLQLGIFRLAIDFAGLPHQIAQLIGVVVVALLLFFVLTYFVFHRN